MHYHRETGGNSTYVSLLRKERELFLEGRPQQTLAVTEDNERYGETRNGEKNIEAKSREVWLTDNNS